MYTSKVLKCSIASLSEQKALEEEKEREKQLRKRIKKQQEKQLKREAYEAMERQKKMMAEETDKDLKGQFPSFLLGGCIHTHWTYFEKATLDCLPN